MDEALRYGQGPIFHVDGQDELAHGVHHHPDPVRGSRQALDRLPLADVAVLDRTAHGEQLVHLHLLNLQVVYEVAREGFQVIGGLH
jgi:hypothetical protein